MSNRKPQVHEASELVQAAQKKEQYVYTADQLLNRNVKEIPMLLEPLLPQVGVVALAGSSDTGKSAFLRQLAYAIALGHPKFLGFGLNLRSRKALYVSTEDDALAISALLQKQKDVSLENGAYKGLRFIFDTAGLRSKLEEQLQIEPVDCVFIDAFADIYDGDMNAVNKVRSFLQGYLDIARRYECLIIFLHHTGKRTESMVPSKDNLIGSQGFEGKMRMVAEFRRDPTESDIRHLCIVKGNYIAQEHKNASFALHFDGRSMQFQNTGRRTEFKELVKRDFSENNDEQRAREVAHTLRQEGKSLRKIETLLGGMGLPGKKSAIGEWVKEDKSYPVTSTIPVAPEDSRESGDVTDSGEINYDMYPEEPLDD